MVFYSSSNSLPRPSLCATELSGLPAGLELLVGVTLSSSESTRNISSLIDNPSRRLPIASISSIFSFNFVTRASKKRTVSGTSLRNNISSFIKVSRSACDLVSTLSLTWFPSLICHGENKVLIPFVTIALLMAADLRLCSTHFPTTSELSQFVLASPTAKRHMLELLAPIQE